MNRQTTPILLVLLVVLMLTGLGLVMISSTAAPLADSSGQLKRQLIWFGGGILAFSVLGWVDYKVWRPKAWIFFGITLLMLAMVFVPHWGSRVKGAYRWLNVPGGFKIQPSEFLRLSLVLVLAHVLAKYQTRLQNWKWGLALPLSIVAMPILLLKLEPDMGTMMLVGVTALVMMYVAGARVWPVLSLSVVWGAGFLAMLWMMPERRARLLAFLNPEQYKEGKAFQIWQGMLAFASGGTDGLGLGNSRQKMFYLPEALTDSILPIIGEELGLYITLAVVIAYAIILVCGIWISLHSRDTFGMLLGFGLVFGLCLQAMMNVATVTSSMPAKGMPLPFVSYGGSNLMISYMAVGLLVSIHRQSLRARRYAEGMAIDENTPRL